MTGLELSREYFEAEIKPRFKLDFPELFDRAAAGLVGNGSECFGYDDEISRDHDWGVDYFIWLPEDMRGSIQRLNDWRLRIFDEHPPVFPRARSEYGARIGVMTVGDFYRSLIGYPAGPDKIIEWLRVPEENLAMCVNGEVFFDNQGEFTAVRKRLLGYFPEDLRRKKLAAKCMAIAQTGQYNHMRMAKRGDWVTVRTALARFNDSVIAMAFLLNRVYRPYYKWAYRAMSELPILGAELSPLLLKLAVSGGFGEGELKQQQDIISSICSLLIGELKRQELAFSDDWFMTSHGEEIQRGIKDELLSRLPAQYE